MRGHSPVTIAHQLDGLAPEESGTHSRLILVYKNVAHCWFPRSEISKK